MIGHFVHIHNHLHHIQAMAQLYRCPVEVFPLLASCTVLCYCSVFVDTCATRIAHIGVYPKVCFKQLIAVAGIRIKHFGHVLLSLLPTELDITVWSAFNKQFT